ncbi:MAG: SH3 domain-containing protein [Clostridia bacterium]|nr:SH3 domain-containing protein [Clostridia bacterium]
MKKLISISLCLLLCLSLCFTWVQAASEYRTWLQSDSRWGSITFGTSDTLSKSGCAITSIAKLMVHSGSVADNPAVFNPGIFCTWLKNNSGITPQGWIVWSAVNDYNGKFTYSGSALLSGTKAQKAATIASYIKEGHVVVAMVKNGGHYVAVDKVVGSKVYIMDPANTGYTDLFQYDAAGVTKIQIYRGVHNGSGGNAPTYDTSVQPIGAGKYTITSGNGVNLRSGAGTSYDVLTAIPYNATVTVSKVSNGWGYTTYNNQKGWFTLEFAKTTLTLRGLQLTPPTQLEYTVGDTLNTDGMKVTALYSDGTSKEITNGYSINEFSSAVPGSCKVYVTYQTKSAEFTVTVNKKAVDYTPGNYAVQSVNGLNLRSDATTDSTVLITVPDQTLLAITQIKENWGKTLYEGHEGWICLDYTTLKNELAKQTGIQVALKRPCILTGDSLKTEDFDVKQVFSDGSLVSTRDFAISVKPIADGILPIIITNGGFQQEVSVKVFDAIPYGDCNFDGLINAVDALNILKFSVQKPVDVFYREVTDLNNDQQIDAKDALLVLRFTVNAISQFPIETVTPTDVVTPSDVVTPTDTVTPTNI